ncbi:MAG: hypothetical protein K6U80_03870 [Firmicutes bacterium]|nr:hypothetical protein [Bacillota bacterium]
MGNFGYIAPLLAPERHPLWKRLAALFPGHFPPARPKTMGAITGSLFEWPVRGYGFRGPGLPMPAWDEARIFLFWDRFWRELQRREVTVVGLGQGTPQPPPRVMGLPGFPGTSDGKALELLLFYLNFPRILDHYEITPPQATATVIWEEGNLGLACARLIGPKLRFLNLVHPNFKVLEHAGEIIGAETGLAPRTFTEIPENYRKLGIIIGCGRLTNYQAGGSFKGQPRYHLFGPAAAVDGASFGLSVTMENRREVGRLDPALGEAVLRACFGLEDGYWCGPLLPLERVLELERAYKNLSGNWDSK